MFMATQSTDTNVTSAVSGIVLSEKNKKTIVDYLGDMLSVESHIEEALDHQLETTKDHPETSAAVHRFHDMVKQNKTELEQYLESLAGSKGNVVKETGATILGKAAGAINRVRTEGVSKSLRDDYVAFNLAAMSYSMLGATARALGDDKTAVLADSGLRDHASAVIELNQIISDVVVWELEKDDHSVDPRAAQANTTAIMRAWQSESPSSKNAH
jgi:ferritin-like metal-binding protein YciE